MRKFRGRIEAKRGALLVGGVRKHVSAPFNTEAEAEAWLSAVKEGNRGLYSRAIVVSSGPIRADALGKRWIICGKAKNGAEYYFSGNSRKPLGGRFVRNRAKATTLQTKFAASEVARHLRPYLYGIGLESLEVKPE